MQEGKGKATERDNTTPAQEHPQDLGSPPPPPSISVTHHHDGSDDHDNYNDDRDSGSDDDDDDIVTMHQIPSNVKSRMESYRKTSDDDGGGGGTATAAAGGVGGNYSSDDDDDDAESEEMRFGGEGLEGFVHSPRGEEGGDDVGLAMAMGMRREEGHEEDLGGGNIS